MCAGMEHTVKIIQKYLILSKKKLHTHTLQHSFSLYREHMDVSAADLFLRVFLVGLSRRSVGSRVSIKWGVFVLNSICPLVMPGLLFCFIRSSSMPRKDSIQNINDNK